MQSSAVIPSPRNLNHYAFGIVTSSNFRTKKFFRANSLDTRGTCVICYCLFHTSILLRNLMSYIAAI
jgi:hypothetical protein